jgi:hypothetical protein
MFFVASKWTSLSGTKELFNVIIYILDFFVIIINFLFPPSK